MAKLALGKSLLFTAVFALGMLVFVGEASSQSPNQKILISQSPAQKMLRSWSQWELSNQSLTRKAQDSLPLVLKESQSPKRKKIKMKKSAGTDNLTKSTYYLELVVSCFLMA